MKNLLVGIIALILVAGGAYYFLSTNSQVTIDKTLPETTEAPELEPVEPTPLVVIPEEGEEEVREPVESIGSSVDGADITAYHFGDGATELLFIGGIHGAFAPNTVDVAIELIDALTNEEIDVPENITVTVIPNMNPDASGTANTLAARMNANDVDLNRNFDCEWDETGTWRSNEVSGGDAPFSEPETAAVKTYVESNELAAIVTWYSAGGGVYSSSCDGTVLRDTNTLTNLYADASGYSAHEEFDFYEITGDMVNWFAKLEIPAISVLLSDYEDAEWEENQAGIEALLEHFATEAE